MIEIKLTAETADAVLRALQEHRNQRTTVREYVDKRYFHMDEAFRNRKIGEVQARIDCLQSFSDRLQTAVALQPKGESK
jgi:hypothetical protein